MGVFTSYEMCKGVKENKEENLEVINWIKSKIINKPIKLSKNPIRRRL
jgi:hypothetical protein